MFQWNPLNFFFLKSIVTTAFREGASIVIDDVNVGNNGL